MASAILPSPSQTLAESGLYREMLDNPLQFGEPMAKNSWAFDKGTKEVVMGPKSPPRVKRRVPLVSGLSSEAKVEERGAGLVNGHGAGDGEGSAVDRLINGSQASTNQRAPRPRSRSRSSTPPPYPGSSQKTLVGPSRSQPSTPTTSRIRKEQDENTPSPRKSKSSSQAQGAGLYPSHIDVSWPEGIATHRKPAAGLYNPSMACYANATLQVLLHTPPVLRIALEHDEESCLQMKKKSFCMLCLLHDMADSHWAGRKAYPAPVLKHLGQIKKGFNKNRQEDTHEFFRFVTDALQNTALAGQPKDLSEKIKHTSWVYRVWGGTVRSRVVCSRCNKPSDTFDHFLDLSLDVNPGKKSVAGMMAGFTREDRLEGDNKYHCENCKAKAVATKSFRIQEAPPILTLHLKRFSVNFNSYSGRARADKFNQFIEFGELLDIAPYMVNPKVGGTRYRLFGVTCHRGNELRFGHYTSYVRHPSGKWFHADDEDMMPVGREQVLSDKTAYLLSYIRVPDGTATPTPTPTPARNGLSSIANGSTPLANGNSSKLPTPATIKASSPPTTANRKRSRSPDSDDELPRAKRDGFIGPRIPPSPQRSAQANGHTDTRAESGQEESDDDMPPELPSRFSYQPKDKPRPTSSTPNKSIYAPKAVPPSSFYTSPLSRPTHPSPGAGNLTKAQRKKLKKAEKKAAKRAGAPMPFTVGQAGQGQSHGPTNRRPGVSGRMQVKGNHHQNHRKALS